MKIRILILALLFNVCTFGQIVTYTPTSTTGVSAANSTASTFNIGAGLTVGTTCAGNWYQGITNSTHTTFAAAEADADYYEFTATPNGGYQLDLTSVSITGLRRSTAGPVSFEWAYQIGAGAWVYQGTPTSSATTNCASVGTPNTWDFADFSTTNTVRFRIIMYGATSTTGTYRMNVATLNGTVTIPCTAPSTQATDFTSSSITSSSATVGWTRGNGNNVIVVARSGSAVNADPTSGTAYTANASFGSGTEIGTGNFVVYNGNGTSVNVTGLTGGITYHFAVYEYNNTSTCYNMTELTGNVPIPIPSPAVVLADNGTQIAAANVAQGTTEHVLHKFQLTISDANTSLTGLSCTTTGTYLTADITNLKVRFSTDATLDVADTTLSTLTGPAAAGALTFPAFTTQALTAGTVRYIFITADISAAATVGRTIGVNAVTTTNTTYTSTPATIKTGTTTAGGLQTITTAPPAVPATFTRSCISNNSVTLNWTPPATGTYDGYLLVVRQGAAPNAVTTIVASSQTFNLDYTLAPTYNATPSRVLYIGNATTATVTGLTQGVSYIFAIHAYKNNGPTSLYSAARTTTQTINLSNVTGSGGTPGNASGTITWTSPSLACYDEILVVATTAAGITFSPTGNGSAYVPNTVYAGNNSIVFNNAGNFVTVTGLTNGVTYYFEIFVRSGTQWSSGVEVSLTPFTSTSFKPGELVFVGFDGQHLGSGQNDEYMLATMVPMTTGTTFSIVNSRYEAGATADTRTDKWGGAGDDPSEHPGVTNFTYTGATPIPAGSVLVFRTNTNVPPIFNYAAVITGTTFTVRTAEFTFTQPPGAIAPNISATNGDGEQIYLIQGSFVSDGTIDTNEANYILNGTLLHGFTIKVGWVPLTSACSGLNAGGNNRQSRLPQALTCFNIEDSTFNTISGYFENDKQHGPTSLRNIIRAIGDVTNNWTISNTRYTIDAASNLATRAGKTFIISTGEAIGQWIGDVDNNWFNCANWGRLTVPDETVDVIIDNVTSVNNAIVDYTATYSDFYLDLAVCNNLTVTGRSAVIQGNINNKLEVYGNVTIGAPGIIDMNDSVNGTADGQLYLYGNWTNNGNQANFDEGEGTVHFMGGAPQIINNVNPRGTELFYNVILNNNFDTAVSNDLIAQGDLTINSGKVVNIDSNGYIFAYKRLNHFGDLSIANNGQFIQVEESDSNTGLYTGTKFELTRTAQAKHLDYVYWSSPTKNFAVANVPNSFRYEWDPLYPNTNLTQGNWVAANGDMTRGKGYIVRASNGAATPTALSTLFRGEPHNGPFTTIIQRGNFDGADYDADPSDPNNLLTTRLDDNWNLVGNPYPSAIDAEEFLIANQTKIQGAVWVWTHGLDPTSNVSPFYNTFSYNYVSSDYIKYNGLGSTDPDTFIDGKIASGQGFMVSMLHAASTPNTVAFNNGMRSDASFVQYDNTDFYKNSVTDSNQGLAQEKHRIWIDIINNNSGSLDRTLLGYSTNSTYGVDHFYDCVFRPTSGVSLYSLIDSEPFIIQGRQLPFDDSDVVPMGVRIAAAGSHTIAIKKVDGLFLDPNQGIYLEDKLLNIVYDLRNSPYVFTSEAGTFNNRFLLRYTTNALGNPDLGAAENNVILTSNQGVMTIKSIVENIQEITVYDILGRQLFESKSIGNKDFTTSNIVRQQTLIVKIKLENGVLVTRKIIL